MSRFQLPDWVAHLPSYFAPAGTYSVVASLLVVVGGVLVNRILIRMVNRRLEDPNRRHVIRKIINYSATSLILLVLLFVWVRNLTFLTAIAGFIAAGLAIAMRDPIMSLFGWMKILWSRPFRVGDRIQVRDLEGDIIDITPLHTVILEIGNWVKAKQSTGRIVFIPNNIIFLESVFNSTLGFPYLWDEFSMTVTFESNFEVAESLLKEPVEEVIGINYRRARQEIRKMGDRYAIRFEQLGPRVYVRVADQGVELTLRFMTRVRGRREIRSRLSKKVMRLLSEHPEVELAYPTYRIFKRGEEPDEPDPPVPEP